MTNEDEIEKRITLLKAELNFPFESQEEDFVSDAFRLKLEEYAASLLNGLWDEDFENDIKRGLAEEPHGIRILEDNLQHAATINELGPVPGDLIERQRQSILAGALKQIYEFAVVMQQLGLRYTGGRPGRTITNSQQPRATGDTPAILQHIQKLENSELKFSIESEAGNAFCLVVEIEYLDPQLSKSDLSMELTGDAGTVVQPFEGNSAEFLALAPGTYTGVLRCNDVEFDRFRAVLQLAPET